MHQPEGFISKDKRKPCVLIEDVIVWVEIVIELMV